MASRDTRELLLTVPEKAEKTESLGLRCHYHHYHFTTIVVVIVVLSLSLFSSLTRDGVRLASGRHLPGCEQHHMYCVAR